jgi:hypothetical protein
MKQSLFCLIFFFFSIAVAAQLHFSASANFNKTELEIKDCDFDSGAEAMVLADEGNAFFVFRSIGAGGWQRESNYRIRIKVLKPKGLKKAEIKLRYFSKNNKEYLTNIDGISFNAGGTGNVTETRLEKSAIFRRDIDENFTEVSFAMPDVKVGTVFEYRFRHTVNSTLFVPAWNFQWDIPVKYSAFTVATPQDFTYTTMSVLRQPLETEVDKKSLIGGTTYIMHNIPGLPAEPYSSGAEGYRQKIEFQLSKIDIYLHHTVYRQTWKKIAEELLSKESFGDELKKNIKATADLDETLKLLVDKREKIQAIYQYVQSNMKWDSSYTIYAEDGVKKAWDKKRGNISEINFILTILFNQAGIKALPLLISTKDNGAIDATTPFLATFNAVYVYVKLGEETFVLNAADKNCPYNLIPSSVINTNALLVSYEWADILKITSDTKFVRQVTFFTGINSDGSAQGNVEVNNYGYAVQENTENKVFEKSIPVTGENKNDFNITINSVKVNEPTQNNTSLTEGLKFTGRLMDANFFTLPCHVFAGLNSNPFTADIRIMNIDYNWPRDYSITGNYVLGDSLNTEVLPKNIKIIMPDSSAAFTRTIQQNENIISVQVKFQIYTTGYAADAYPYVKEFFKKMYELLDEKIIIKKNK